VSGERGLVRATAARAIEFQTIAAANDYWRKS
jgi:hypothetical protein